MRKTLLFAALAGALALPAMSESSYARTYHHNWYGPAGAAYGLAVPIGPRFAGPRSRGALRGGVVVDGRYQGNDPDFRVREQLQRDPPHAG